MGRVKLGAFADDGLSVAPADSTEAHGAGQDAAEPGEPAADELMVQDMADDLRDNGQLHNINLVSLERYVQEKPHLASKLGPEPYVVINDC